MELLSGVKALTYFKKMLMGETSQILPFTPIAQKPLCPDYSGLRLARSTPESEGVPSELLEAFYRRLATGDDAGLHSVMVLRHGKVISEGGFAPFSTKFWHVTHSLCKSVTGTAIGMLIDDGILDFDDKICDIFSDKCTFLTGKRMRSITIRHLLTMQSGSTFKEIGAVLERDWVRAFIEADVAFEPGSRMDYNSMNSYMLSAVVTRKTGLTLCDYLKPRLFDKLGFGEIAWETCPLGITKGGWGMYIFPEDLAKIGQLYLQGGIWNVHGESQQIISNKWIIEATKPWTMRDTGEEYGYQLWPHSDDGSFLFNGMFGQYVMMMPSLDIVILMNAGNGHLFTHSFAYDTVVEYFNLNALSNAPLPQNSKQLKSLQYTLSHLVFGVKSTPKYREQKWYEKILSLFKKPIVPMPFPEKANALIGRTLCFSANNAGLEPIILQCTCDSYTHGVCKIGFALENDFLTLLWTEGSVTSHLPLGFNEAKYGIATLNDCKWHIGSLASFAYNEDGQAVLKIKFCFVESSSTRLVKIIFKENGAVLRLDESPAVALAIEKVKNEQSALAKGDPVFFKDFGYIEYKINKICTPILNGIWE
ncbi:MAG: serine hydrolase [Oscillospiraceae bacterium]